MMVMALIRLSSTRPTTILHQQNVNFWRFFLSPPPSVPAEVHQHQKFTKIDAIDSFTSDLVERKSHKWNTLYKSILKQEYHNLNEWTKVITNSILQDMRNIQSPDLELNIIHLTSKQIDNILLESLEDHQNHINFLKIFQQCLKHKHIPSSIELIFECLKYLSMYGQTDLIEQFDCLMMLEMKTTVLSAEYPSNIDIFKGLSNWHNGKYQIALNNLELVYSQQQQHECLDYKTKRRVHNAFKYIAEQTLNSKSEAILVCLMKTVELIYEKHQDIIPIAYVWRNCFDSNWLSDQQLSIEIYDRFIELRTFISKRSNSLCSQFLRKGELDSVYRLIELFLKYQDRDGYSNCLTLLFDYQYYQNNLRACSEIVKCCTELNVPLNNIQCQKLITLLLQKPPSILHNYPILKELQYQYKF